jgi:hypothetical protein
MLYFQQQQLSWREYCDVWQAGLHGKTTNFPVLWRWDTRIKIPVSAWIYVLMCKNAESARHLGSLSLGYNISEIVAE